MSYRSCVCLLAGTRWNISFPLAVRPSRTCRVLFQNKINLRYCASGWFYYRNRNIIILYYNIVGPLSYMRSVIDWNVIMQRMTVHQMVLRVGWALGQDALKSQWHWFVFLSCSINFGILIFRITSIKCLEYWVLLAFFQFVHICFWHCDSCSCNTVFMDHPVGFVHHSQVTFSISRNKGRDDCRLQMLISECCFIAVHWFLS